VRGEIEQVEYEVELKIREKRRNGKEKKVVDLFTGIAVARAEATGKTIQS